MIEYKKITSTFKPTEREKQRSKTGHTTINYTQFVLPHNLCIVRKI